MTGRLPWDEVPEQLLGNGRGRPKRRVRDAAINVSVLAVVFLSMDLWHQWWPLLILPAFAVIRLAFLGRRMRIDRREDIRWEREAKGSD